MKAADPAYVSEDDEPNPALNALANRIIDAMISVRKALCLRGQSRI